MTGRLGVFGYFTALGLGFMLIEQVAIQRMILTLGHPVYALTVVLLTLLVASGVGSYWAETRERWLARGLSRRVALVFGWAVVTGVLVLWLPPKLLPFPAVVGFVGCILALVPVGLFLGQWFPAGIRRLEDRPALIPWVWAVNGWASVLGAVLAIILAMSLGFPAVYLAACACYVGAAGLYARL